MSRLNASNNAVTELTDDVSASDTTIHVLDTGTFPSVPFLISINREIMEVTSASSDSFTVERGKEGTTARAHDKLDDRQNGTKVENRFTAGMYDDLKAIEQSAKDYTDEQTHLIILAINEIDFATKQQLSDHTSDTDNPHSVTKSQVGLSSVDNVKQASKSEFDAHTHSADEISTSDGNVQSDIDNLKSSVSDGKDLIGTAITDKDDNVTVPSEPSFSDLADAVGEISSGVELGGVATKSGSYWKAHATHVRIPKKDVNDNTVTSYREMFRGDEYVEYVEAEDSSEVTNMQNMFHNSKATSLDLTNFDTSNVTNMQFMFQSSSAEAFDLSSFDTSNVTNMSYMFRASQATTLDLSSFDVSKADVSFMFEGALATTGYARTQADADKLNSSQGKPSGLTFVVK